MKEKKKSIMIRPRQIFVILLLSFAFLYRINGVPVPWYYQYLVSMPIFLYCVFKIIFSKNNNKIIWSIMTWAWLPYLLITVYSLFLYLIKYNTSFALSRGISICLQMLYIISFVCVFNAVFQEVALDILAKSCLFSYLITVIMAIYNVGISGLWTYIISPNNATSDILPFFEMHDIGLSIGFFIIYYILFSAYTSKKKLIIFSSILVLYMTYKRIAIVALIVAILVGVLFFRKKSKLNLLQQMFVLIIIFTFCVIYTVLISNGEFYLLAENYNINISNRAYLYVHMKKFYEISIDFLGKGLGFTGKYFTVEGWNITFLHNDILRCFIEFGFWGFIVWFVYYLCIIPKKMNDKYGINVVNIYCVLSIYAYIVYATDNTMIYFVFQFVFWSILAQIIYKENEVK